VTHPRTEPPKGTTTTMAKKSSAPASNARQAKIQAAQKQQGGGANKIVVATVVLVVAIIAVVAGVIWVEQSKQDEITGGGNALPPGVSELGAGFPAFADVTPNEGAPTLDLYEDFQCPACASFEALLGPTIEELATAGDIRLVYHVKNFLDDNLRNDSSTRAGNAAFCAADAGKFQEYHDQLYTQQPATEGDGFSNETLTSIATSVGISGDALTTWESCLKAGRYTDYVNSVEEASFQDGVRGTPTVRINGEEIELAAIQTPDLLKQAVEVATK
jgi:protein-disulfide isomerase